MRGFKNNTYLVVIMSKSEVINTVTNTLARGWCIMWYKRGHTENLQVPFQSEFYHFQHYRGAFVPLFINMKKNQFWISDNEILLEIFLVLIVG